MTSSIPARLRRRLAAPAAALALAVGAASALVAASAGAAEAGSSSSPYGTLSAADSVLPAAQVAATTTRNKTSPDSPESKTTLADRWATLP